MSDARHHHDGEPYYCKTCGFGIGEYFACEEPDCELESVEDAQARKARHESK